MREQYEKRIYEQEKSIKILTKTIERNDKQSE